MIRSLKHSFGDMSSADSPRFEGGPPAPDRAFALVGDIHGAARCLDLLLERLAQEAPELPLVFAGDYVDRGEESATVLERLHFLSLTRPDTVLLRGNHEELMLDFLDDPGRHGNRWMRHGGLQTMASFGFGGLTERNGPDRLTEARDHLRDRLGAQKEAWLRDLPRLYRNGNVAVVHAGADPARELDDQDPDTLTWGHPRFGRDARRDGVWIAHGHTIVDMPRERNGVISVDTGAYATGRLTAALIRAGAVEFVQS
ncbi:metallophosphoesterase [Celeribacter indicus]|uniref:Metallophosphoesterase n=1 Tax=Celeribacter indicus TaxID=1208324 RepID=A0A0B5DYT6_9RHOB|nr:metallophosphoesterase [Celeribacter indicus]AJE45881.1 metallophosphoesterase [Celeribacter indicus]SDW62888.1 serine/threonine protein phosphatase 1 [Celeribacter indicus]